MLYQFIKIEESIVIVFVVVINQSNLAQARAFIDAVWKIDYKLFECFQGHIVLFVLIISQCQLKPCFLIERRIAAAIIVDEQLQVRNFFFVFLLINHRLLDFLSHINHLRI